MDRDLHSVTLSPWMFHHFSSAINVCFRELKQLSRLEVSTP
ncbi:unnamed protein product [Musa acuminata subsp. malaccensis]|uniref:(wild Malaysian banana) hypothetical protein n=1 Tax=Musa acuminata subsp. malaccensis TaxID=214687 RepID=A0A804J1L7_MUSAM|nr:unnamed protein product [Musa acuminata subsp. malaccensis]